MVQRTPRICAGSMSPRPQVAFLLKESARHERRTRVCSFVGGHHETTTHYSANGGTDNRCRSVTDKFGSGLARLARRRMGLARGGARGSSSRYRASCAVVLRRLRRLWDRIQLPVLRLWLWDYQLQLSVLRLWHRLQLPGLRLWHRLQLPGLWLWLSSRHSPPRSLCRRLASLALKSRTKASRRVLAEERRAPR